MPIDGGGFYTRLYDFEDDRDDGIRILASRMDAELNGIADALNADRKASTITYNGEALDAILARLLYVPLSATGFTSSITQAENGSTVGGVTLTWALNRDPTTQRIDITDVPVSQRTYLVNGPITGTKTFTLYVGDGTTSVTVTVSITFMDRRYWGISANAAIDDASLRVLQNELSTSKIKTVVYDATTPGYFYYAYPAAYGAVTVKVAGLPFSDYTLTTRQFVNSFGYSTSYNILRSNNIQTGSAIQVEYNE